MEERSRRIVETAIELAEQGGYEAVRLRDVAAHAGVALGTVYKRFSSKEDILVAALERETQAFEKLTENTTVPGATAEERVAAFFVMVTRAVLIKPNFARAVVRAVASGEPATAEKVARFHERITGLIMWAIDCGPGEMPAALSREDPARVGYLLQQIWFAAMLGWMGGLHGTDEVERQMSFATRLILR